jgi:hypothetical protein
MKNSELVAHGASRNSFVHFSNLICRTIVCFLVIGGVFFIPCTASAQAYSHIDVNEYGYTVTFPNVVLDAGESVEVIVEIDATVNNVAGFSLTFDLSALAAKHATLTPSVEDSWLRENGVAVTEMLEDGVYVYNYERTGTVDGGGELMRLRLWAAENDVQASDLLNTSTGVLIVDNLDIRQSAPESDLQVWPNPTTGICQIHSAESPVVATKILSVNGQLLRNCEPVNTIDLTDLATGIYFLEITDQLGHVFRRSIQRL